jgi:hypothetical protein
MRASASSAPTAWWSTVLRARGEYCFGVAAPNREPEPAAGINPKYLAVTYNP